MTILVTGAAGFIGFHLTRHLVESGHPVCALDNMNSYYLPRLKDARRNLLEAQDGVRFVEGDIADETLLSELMQAHEIRTVINLAAQAGVRYSLENPYAYVHSNLLGMTALLEASRKNGIEHLIYASSSSVYGGQAPVPFDEAWSASHPSSFYAATKRANELMAHTYSHLYGLPTTGLRFFTVYGPWGRPDMAYWLFTDAILSGRPIKVFNHGDMSRDFTYIDDIVSGVASLLGHVPRPDPAWDPATAPPNASYAPFRVYNIGNNQPVQLTDMIDMLEDILGQTATREYLGMQPGDVPATYARIDTLSSLTGFSPKTDLRTGLERFVDWFRQNRERLDLSS